MAALTQTTIEAEISAWARSKSGKTVIWEVQNAPPPQKPYLSLAWDSLDGVIGMGAGMDELQPQTTAGVVKAAMHRRISLTVKAWSNEVLGSGKATEILKTLRKTLNIQDVQIAFIKAGLKVIPGGGEIQDTSAMLDTRGESRGEFDCEFAVLDTQTENRGYIATVATTVHVKDNGGLNLPNISITAPQE